MKVLIVDDDVVSQQLLERILLSRGHEVTICADAETAWEIYQKAYYPLIILDWLLPGMDGLQFCYQLRALPHGDRSIILMITTRNQPDSLLQILDAGVDDYLAKPIDIGLLNIHLTIAERQVYDRTMRKQVETKLEEMIVQLKKSRDDMTSILNYLRVGTAMIDKDGCVTFLSQIAQQFFEKTAEDILGESWEQLCPFQLEELAQLKAIVQMPVHLRTRVPVHIEVASGRHYWMEVEVQNDPSNPNKYIFYFYDMSEVHDLKCLVSERMQFYDLIGKSEPMQLLYRYIRELANITSTVLIEGETGTGKELVARAIHFYGKRSKQPFIALNCAGLTESLLTSQLFGYKRGAFTGAIADTKGLLEAANGGTLFLDEIGDIPGTVQTLLLRVLQEREITRLGETSPRKIDVHILAATHRNLTAEVSRGNFREDLLYRIRVARITLPPLRERCEDIPLLIASFLAKFRVEIGKAVQEVSHAAMQILVDYNWPGNVRELKSAVEFAVIRCRGSVVLAEDLPPEILSTAHPQTRFDSLYQNDKKRFIAALEHARGNRSEAARLLGVSRATFYRRLEEFQFSNAELAPSAQNRRLVERDSSY